MKSNKLIVIAGAVILAAWAIKVYAGTINMTTYYPAPNGYYENLTVTNKLIYPCYKVAPVSPPANAMWAVGSFTGCLDTPPF